MHPAVLADAEGDCPECGMKLVEAEAVYTCPMHPEVKTSAAGDCPSCGMDLVAAPGAAPAPAGEHDHAGHEH